MNKKVEASINNKWIVSTRGKKNHIDPQKPYSWLVEKERTRSGKIEDTGTIFLSNLECPFRCLMCDLWKNTTNKSVRKGDIPNQIEWALKQMPEVKHLKLYNSGNFFDKKAIPEEDYSQIASLLSDFETVIVESHPKFINKKCLLFKEMLKPELEVAIGLETVHLDVLQKLNKQMTLNDFSKAVRFLAKNGIRSRAFILLRPPFLSESEGIFWANKSIDYAFEVGVQCCTVIPVRAGNGAMDILMDNGNFSLPKLNSLEAVLDYGIGLSSGRVFADVWDLELFSDCEKCFDERQRRLMTMNLNQKNVDQVACNCTS
jgi:radical SAM enzyme (TIGR01210 family)